MDWILKAYLKMDKKNNFLSIDVIEKLHALYPRGTMVILDKMEDKQAPGIGTVGEVLSVDDIGTVRHALSRRANIIICDSCGTKESIEEAVAAGVMKGNDPLPIEEWAVAKGAYHIYAEED